MFTNRLDFIFFYHHQEDTKILSHQHQCYEIVYYLSGSGTTNIDGIEHNYADNTFSFIRPNTYHNEVHHEDTNLFCIGFSRAGNPFAPIENGVYQDHYCSLQKIVKEMKHELLAKKPHYNVKLDLLLSEYLIEFDRMRSVVSVSDSLQYILNYIHENFNLNIEIPALAKLSGYSYDHFRHMFKARTGLSPMNYIISRRIDYAKKLIETTDMTMSMISHECGFSTSSQFSSLFNRLIGMTPRQYKQAVCSQQTAN